jgi:hypothetical protein
MHFFSLFMALASRNAAATAGEAANCAKRNGVSRVGLIDRRAQSAGEAAVSPEYVQAGWIDTSVGGFYFELHLRG